MKVVRSENVHWDIPAAFENLVNEPAKEETLAYDW